MPQSIEINEAKNLLRVSAIARPDQFNNPMSRGLENHHLLTYQNSKAGQFGLFVTKCSENELQDALMMIHARPGNDLTLSCWDDRKNPHSKAPDGLTQGSDIEVSVQFNNQDYNIFDFLVDKNNYEFHFRFAGNRKNREQWKLGCIICLQNCPGGVIVNTGYTTRDLYNKKCVFKKNKKRIINPGDPVIFEIKKK